MRRVLFDKTGTLTEGRPVLRDVHLRARIERRRTLALVAAAEQEVLHPVAQALREAGGGGLVASGSERFESGVKATVDGSEVLVGSRGFLVRNGIEPPEEQHGNAGLTVVLMAVDGSSAAQFFLGDALRPDAARTVSGLRETGLTLGMASGDAAVPCAYGGALMGLQAGEIWSDCTPEDKAALVEAGPGPTAFVGDGVNDTLAILRADVVIARGGVAAVGKAIAISRKARRVLRQNLVFSVV